MKKLLAILVLGLLYFTINSSHAKDMVTWGPAGGSCNGMKKILEYEEGELMVTSYIQGVLSGIASFLNKTDKLSSENCNLELSKVSDDSVRSPDY